MNVRQLIETLETFNPDADVTVPVNRDARLTIIVSNVEYTKRPVTYIGREGRVNTERHVVVIQP